MGRSLAHVGRALLIALTLLIVGSARPAAASSPYLVVPSDEVRQASPAFRHANLSDDEAYAELERRDVPFIKAGETKGVRAPVRLTGPLHGVHVHSSLPPEQRATTPFEILDARLALSLDDFCALLERHDIVELVHYTMYRPNGPKPGLEHVAGKRKGKRSKTARSKTKARARKTARSSNRSRSRKGLGKGTKSSKRRARSSKKPSKKKSAAVAKHSSKKRPSASPKRKGRRKGKAVSRKRSRKTSKRAPAKRSRKRRSRDKPVKKSSYAPPGTRHPAGLAIDVGGLRKRDGRWLSVAHHFHGRIGTRTCGPNTTPPKSPQARELWSIVCEAADLGLFTYVLTPNYDAPHADHFHMEIRGDVKWFLYH